MALRLNGDFASSVTDNTFADAPIGTQVTRGAGSTWAFTDNRIDVQRIPSWKHAPYQSADPPQDLDVSENWWSSTSQNVIFDGRDEPARGILEWDPPRTTTPADAPAPVPTPDTTIAALPPKVPAGVEISPPTFTGTGLGAGGHLECDQSLYDVHDSGPYWVPCTSPWPWTVTSTNTGLSLRFRVRAVNADGVPDPTPALVTTVVGPWPNVTITGGPADFSLTASRSASIPFKTVLHTDRTEEHPAGPGEVALECDLDGTTLATCASPVALSGLTDGTHTLTITATEPTLGGQGSASRTWRVDGTPPTQPQIQSPTDGAFLPDSPSAITWAESTDITAVTYQLLVDGSIKPWASSSCTSGTCTGSTLTPIANGTHVLRIRATDAAGNTSESDPVTITIGPITPLPAPVVDAPTEGATVTTDKPTLTWAPVATDLDVSYELSVDGSTRAWQNLACTATVCSGQPAIGLSDGTRVLQVIAHDIAGQTTPSADRTITVDYAPAISFSAGPTGGSTSGSDSATFAFTVNQPGATVTCTLDASDIPCVSPVTVTDLAEGTHTFAVTATKPSGQSTTASRTWIVDTIAPTQPVITAPAADSYLTSTPTSIVWTPATDATPLIYALRIDGVFISWGFLSQSCTASSCSGLPLVTLADGPHTMTITARDAAGHLTRSATRTFTIGPAPDPDPDPDPDPGAGGTGGGGGGGGGGSSTSAPSTSAPSADPVPAPPIAPSPPVPAPPTTRDEPSVPPKLTATTPPRQDVRRSGAVSVRLRSDAPAKVTVSARITLPDGTVLRLRGRSLRLAGGRPTSLKVPLSDRQLKRLRKSHGKATISLTYRMTSADGSVRTVRDRVVVR